MSAEQRKAMDNAASTDANVNTLSLSKGHVHGIVMEIKSESEAKELVAANETVVLKFSAKWCGPCQAVKPLVDQWAQQYTSIIFADIDVDQVPGTASAYGVTAMPTFVFIHNNKETGRVRGADLPEIENRLKLFSK